MLYSATYQTGPGGVNLATAAAGAQRAAAVPAYGAMMAAHDYNSRAAEDWKRTQARDNSWTKVKRAQELLRQPGGAGGAGGGAVLGGVGSPPAAGGVGQASGGGNAQLAGQILFNAGGVPRTSQLGGGAAAASGNPLSNLINTYTNATNDARTANEQRYDDILGGYVSRYQRNLDTLAGAGQQERTDIGTQYDNLRAGTEQQLTSRGLANTTALTSGMAGVERQRADAIGRLNDRLTSQRVNLDSGLSGDTLQFMERRQDTYPDLNQLAQLAQGLGAAGPYGGAGTAGAGNVAGPGSPQRMQVGQAPNLYWGGNATPAYQQFSINPGFMMTPARMGASQAAQAGPQRQAAAQRPPAVSPPAVPAPQGVTPAQHLEQRLQAAQQAIANGTATAQDRSDAEFLTTLGYGSGTQGGSGGGAGAAGPSGGSFEQDMTEYARSQGWQSGFEQDVAAIENQPAPFGQRAYVQQQMGSRDLAGTMQSFQTFQDVQGRQFQARFMGLGPGGAEFQLPDGRIASMLPQNLAPQSQQQIEQAMQPSARPQASTRDDGSLTPSGYLGAVRGGQADAAAAGQRQAAQSGLRGRAAAQGQTYEQFASGLAADRKIGDRLRAEEAARQAAQKTPEQLVASLHKKGYVYATLPGGKKKAWMPAEVARQNRYQIAATPGAAGQG